MRHVIMAHFYYKEKLDLHYFCYIFKSTFRYFGTSLIIKETCNPMIKQNLVKYK